MVIGVVSFTSGAIIYSKTKNEIIKTNPHNELDKEIKIATNESVIDEEKKNQRDIEDKLEEIIKMAIADGVLTDNERKNLKEFTLKHNLDYSIIIKEVELRLKKSDTKSETEVIDYKKKNGDDFEKFVVKKFNKRYFKLKEWAGDKYIEGRYAETTLNPDLLYEFKLRQEKAELSVECKWRQNFDKGGVEFAGEEQLKRYKAFETKRGIPVFIAIGVGGTGAEPKNLYIVPLKEASETFISSDRLQEYKKNIDKNFFFDNKTKVLK